MLPHGSHLVCGTVKVCMHDHDGNPIGCQSDNIIIDPCLFDIQFPDDKLLHMLHMNCTTNV